MARKDRNFGQVIRDRRRQLDLTQEEVAKRIKTSTPYVGHLESGKRHPSDKIVTRLAEGLGLDRRDLFFLANPRAQALLTPAADSATDSEGEAFHHTEQLTLHRNIHNNETATFSGVALIGRVSTPRQIRHIPTPVRTTVGR